MSVKWDKRFLELAKLVSTWSRDPSTKVGAVIVRPDGTICSMGFNGFPKKIWDNPELYKNREEKYKRVIHAEKNAMIFSRENMTGYTLYTYPFPPCERCAVEIIQAGITKIVSLTPSEELNARWKDSLTLSRDLFFEAEVKLTLYPPEFLNG